MKSVSRFRSESLFLKNTFQSGSSKQPPSFSVESLSHVLMISVWILSVLSFCLYCGSKTVTLWSEQPRDGWLWKHMLQVYFHDRDPVSLSPWFGWSHGADTVLWQPRFCETEKTSLPVVCVVVDECRKFDHFVVQWPDIWQRDGR